MGTNSIVKKKNRTASPVPLNWEVTLGGPGAAAPVSIEPPPGDSLRLWLELHIGAGSAASPQTLDHRRRDCLRLIAFMEADGGADSRPLWTPRLSRAFLDALRLEKKPGTGAHLADTTISRIISNIKTFGHWLHRISPLPLGYPCEGLRAPAPAPGLVEKAVTRRERRLILDAADLLPLTGGRSRDRSRHGNRPLEERPVRKGYRPQRNRAIIYVLMETGMRRSGVVNLRTDGIDTKNHLLTTREKGGRKHSYPVSKEGLKALMDYVNSERPADSPSGGREVEYVFLPAVTAANRSDQLRPEIVNRTWNEVCKSAGVSGRTTHSARHGVGAFIMGETGNAGAVRQQLGHASDHYSTRYTQTSAKKLSAILDSRNAESAGQLTTRTKGDPQ